MTKFRGNIIGFPKFLYALFGFPEKMPRRASRAAFFLGKPFYLRLVEISAEILFFGDSLYSFPEFLYPNFFVYCFIGKPRKNAARLTRRISFGRFPFFSLVAFRVWRGVFRGAGRKSPEI